MNNTEEKNEKIIKSISSILGLPWVVILTEAWKYGNKILRGMTSEGIYEVLDYEMFLDLIDENGKKASFRKIQKVQYMQNNVIAFYDQAWGDGKILLDYRCKPGVPVDRIPKGHKTLILISLRQIRNRGDQSEIRIKWDMKGSFLTNLEEWTTSISHRTKRLKLNITFPEKRPPLKMSIIEANRQKQISLGKDNLEQLPDNRWLVSWEKDKPRLYEDYIFRWEW